MKIEIRGQAPYKISTGPSDEKYNNEQFAIATTFRESFLILFDLCDGGKLSWGCYILDSLEQKVFDTALTTDMNLVKEADVFGAEIVEFIENS